MLYCTFNPYIVSGNMVNQKFYDDYNHVDNDHDHLYNIDIATIAF